MQNVSKMKLLPLYKRLIRVSIQDKARLFTSRQCSSFSDVRVRFAPSPTGHLHLGSLRTALYNYLFTRQHGGKFLLRVEDTDQSRVVPGSVEKCVEMLNWAGIHIDEGPFQGGNVGPYVQSERLALYQEHIKTLLQNGSAYCCFCSARRLELLRKDQARRRETSKYDNCCRGLSKQEVDEKIHKYQENRWPYVVRFKLTPFTDAWHDLVFGDITNNISEIEGDPVLMKSDGFPTYHFASIVDDHLMDISHVIRGVEWQVSTPKHLLLYKAFGWKAPSFAHLPVILNKDGTKLSKRQGDIHIEHLKDAGYYPESLLGLLTSMGSGFTTDSSTTSTLSMQQLIENFDLSLLKRNSTRLEKERIGEYNKVQLQKKIQEVQSREDLIKQLRSQLKHSGFAVSSMPDSYIQHILLWAQDRICKLSDLLSADLLFLWSLPQVQSVNSLPQIIKDKSLSRPTNSEDISRTLQVIQDLSEEELQEKETIARAFEELAKKHDWKYPMLMKTMRISLTGLMIGPPVSEIIQILGKEAALYRIRLMMKHLDTVQGHTAQNQTQALSSEHSTPVSVQISDGVSKKILQQGNGAIVQKGNRITVHCTGILKEQNSKFWSTKDPGQQPFTYKAGVGEVITGWDEGCLTMRQGEVSRITVAGYKGYGKQGFPAWNITPDATLIFEIEILNIR